MAGLNPLYHAPDKWRPGDNLLDNACFLNVVNQRGEKEYMGVVYGIDRWIGLDTRTIVSVEDGYVKVSASDGADSLWAIRQAVKPEARNFLKNRLATVSVLSTKGLVSLTSDKFFVSDISKQSQNEDGLDVWVNADSVLIAFMSGGKSELIAAMLEPGPEQHLAHKEGGKWVLNRVPDYGEELMKCQSYQYEVFDRTSALQGYLARVMAITEIYAYGTIPLTTPMRLGALPALVTDCCPDSPYSYAGISSTGFTIAPLITNIAIHSMDSKGVTVVATGSNFVPGNLYQIFVEAQNQHQFLLDRNL